MTPSSLDMACAIEILTPLAPNAFIILASVANVAKNIGWMTASATRAAIHRNLAKMENLGDVTAKAASQSTACGALGTALGMGVSLWIGNTQVSSLIMAFAGLSAIHLTAVYKALSHVSIQTLNHERLAIIAEHALNQQEKMISPQDMVRLENIILPFQSPYKYSEIRSDVELDQMIPKQQDVSEIMYLFSDRKYIINATQGHGKSKNQVVIAWNVDAQQADLIESYYLASKISKNIELEAAKQNITDKKLKEILKTATLDDSEISEFTKQLKSAGWDTKHTFLEISPMRYSVEYSQKTES